MPPKVELCGIWMFEEQSHFKNRGVCCYFMEMKEWFLFLVMKVGIQHYYDIEVFLIVQRRWNMKDVTQKILYYIALNKQSQWKWTNCLLIQTMICDDNYSYVWRLGINLQN